MEGGSFGISGSFESHPIYRPRAARAQQLLPGGILNKGRLPGPRRDLDVSLFALRIGLYPPGVFSASLAETLFVAFVAT